MAKTVRTKPARLFRRCRIENDFPTVLHVEGQLREREQENSRVFGFLRRPLRRGFSARSAQRTCTKGALVHVGCFSTSNPSRISSRMVSQAIGLSRILSRMVSRCRGAKKTIPVRAGGAETRSRRGTEGRRKDRVDGDTGERGPGDLGSGRTPIRTIAAL